MQDSSSKLIIKELPPTGQRLPLFIVGDVHGCSKELHELILIAKKQISQFQLVLVGDLFTKGPDPVGVYEQIIDHNAICIKGNHDWALWSIILQSQKKPMESFAIHSQQTLNLIRYHKKAIFRLLAQMPHAVITKITPQNKNNKEKEYPLVIVHAGIDPTRGLLGTTERMLLTARYVKFEEKDNEKRLVVVPSHSRTEFQKPHHTSSTPDRMRWHELHTGPELIVFGHDAKQGLFRKTLPDGRPICVGIDTGCTYGNSLTGYFPEIDLAVQVRAKRKYFDMKKNLILIKNIFEKDEIFGDDKK